MAPLRYTTKFDPLLSLDLRKGRDRILPTDNTYNDDQVNVTITSDDYFGARHALETLFQERHPESLVYRTLIRGNLVIQ